MKLLQHGLMALVILVLAVSLTPARGGAAPPAAPASAVVTANAANLRSGPSTEYRIVGRLSQGDEIDIVAQVEGEDVFGGNPMWYRLPSGRYVYSGLTSARSEEPGSSASESGRMIVVDRGAQVARAIENGQVVHTAPVVVGRPNFPTPVGSFQVLRRVADETMDSRTTGIPLEDPNGYYLAGVLYTQYITDDGAALHFNYWTPEEAFGHVAATHGCVGLRLADARFFWDFADVGTPVIIKP